MENMDVFDMEFDFALCHGVICHGVICHGVIEPYICCPYRN